MDEMITGQPKAEASADYEAAVEELLRGIREVNDAIQADQQENERLRLEAQRIKQETRAILASIRARL